MTDAHRRVEFIAPFASLAIPSTPVVDFVPILPRASPYAGVRAEIFTLSIRC